ncbi:MAG: pyridoxamine 5'-phosphate oxidase family protein [Gammaproteobacteria bacterium]|nr:pyridoxamine 5'-phosphate oxidase family protein [Gammaproteobacteria bacterium]
MAQRFDEISENLQQFIERQKLFFVATAAADGRVNLSPKGMDSLKVLDKNRVLWLNVTGSGNETAAHLLENSRMTLMFCAFEDEPLILRLYGEARAIHSGDDDWQQNLSLFVPLPGARQIYELSVDLVQTSCGAGVPLYDYVGDRDELNNWSANKGSDGVKAYWREKNQLSIDGKPTQIMERTD